MLTLIFGYGEKQTVESYKIIELDAKIMRLEVIKTATKVIEG